MRRRLIAAVALALALVLGSGDAAFAITRSEILSRAKRWADREVPYSQSAYYDGYRTDCSGMASMAWKLDRSYTTRSLAPHGVRIHRDELQPGDMLLKYDYHAMIFYKWANAEHTWYWTLETSGGMGHAGSRLTRYPYWGHDNVYAYRPKHIQEVNDYGSYIHQVAGQSRYGTAIAASRLVFPSGSATRAVVCSGENWPDALGASALAGSLGGPVLLVGRNYIPGDLRGEIARLGVREITVVGGEAAISRSVSGALDAIPNVSVSRIGGANRYETAALMASATVEAQAETSSPFDGAVYVATGRTFPDALGAATVAAYTGRPILLAEPDSLPDVVMETLRSLGASRAYIAGGTSALSPSVETSLTAEGLRVRRLAGGSRYDTSLALARHGAREGLAWDDVALATGESFPDALAGAVMQAHRGSALVLTPSGRLDPAADWAIREHLDVIDRVTVLGGVAAVKPIVRRQIRWVIDEP